MGGWIQRARGLAGRLPGGTRPVATVLTAVAVTQALVAPIASPAVSLAIAVLTTVPLLALDRHPVAVALTTTAAGLIPSDGYVYVGYVVAFVAFYAVGAHLADGRMVAAAVACGMVLAVAGSIIHGAAFGEYFGALSAVAAPAVVGRVVRYQRRQSARLRELTEHLEREREHRVAAAVAEERTRIARELHDVIAHEVSVIAIQSDAAEAALSTDASLAAAPLRTIRSSAVDALDEMRRLLTVLRRPDEPSGSEPQPGLAQLPSLLERARALGLEVTLETRGRPVHVPASLDLAAYRIVQESLTNVSKHAGGAAASVVVSWSDDALEVEVRDRGRGGAPNGTGAGHGLVGMRERVRVHGGVFDAGPQADGGFRVHAVLPLREAG